MFLFAHINSRRYVVEPADAARLEADVLVAVRSGGAFLDLDDALVGHVRVLVTSASRVWFQEKPTIVDFAAVDDNFPDLNFLDLE